MLWRLAVYARAGQDQRLRATLEQLAIAPEWDCRSSPAKYFVRNVSANNLPNLRFYYDQLCPTDSEYAESFVRLWEQQGVLKELDSWLASRSSTNDEWLMQRVYFRKKLGTADEIIDELAAELRANPADERRLERYLRAANYGEIRDVGWVADVFEMRLAFDYFKLGSRLSRMTPAAAARLLEKSLALPFTDQDAKLTKGLFYRNRSVAPALKINWEKQLRYWTRHDLAESYKFLNRPLEAQPIVEELVNMEGDDIELRDAHQLAGGVQAASGQRVVETGILRDEVSRRGTAQYWIERTQYYRGRNENNLEWESYREALVALPDPRDSKTATERLALVSRFAFFLADNGEGSEARRIELTKLLQREFAAAPVESDYAFRLAELITQNEFELDDLRISLLTNQPELFARLLAGRQEWGSSEQRLIESVMECDAIKPEQRKKIWSQLERLAADPGSTRAYILAEAMLAREAIARALPLLEGYLKHARPANWEGYRTEATRDLLDAYIKTGTWRMAEALLFSEKGELWGSYPAFFSKIAVAAAQRGAIDDAVRLWQLAANLDRREIENLKTLARTGAKPRLQAIYSEMKKKDPESSIPEHALQLLQ